MPVLSKLTFCPIKILADFCIESDRLICVEMQKSQNRQGYKPKYYYMIEKYKMKSVNLTQK